jgi:hypothetical protein
MQKIKFEDRLSVYYRDNLKFFLLHKYGLEISSFGIEKIEIFYKGNALTDDVNVIMQSLVLLESISGFIQGKFKYIGAVKKFFFCGSVTLRKVNIFKFFNFMCTCAIPVYIKRNGVLLSRKSNDLKIKDLSIFSNFKVLNFKGFVEIKVTYNEDYFTLIKDLLKILKIKY